MLKYGRLYAMKVRRGNEWLVNTEDFDVQVGATRNVATPKPHKGLEVTDRATLEAAVRRMLRGLPATEWYPCLVVWPDSFEEFLMVKATLVEQGYRYRVLPTEGGVLDRGGDGRPQ